MIDVAARMCNMDNEILKVTPAEIIETLHSITKLSVEDGELDVWQYDDTLRAGIHSFTPGSFARNLLQLIEDFMLEGEPALEIIDVLKSTRKVEMVSDGLDIYFEGTDEVFSASEFVIGSFTRELIDLIAEHVKEE